MGVSSRQFTSGRPASSPAVRHHVLLRFKPETTAEQVKNMEDALKTLPAIIPEIQKFQAGKQVPDIDDGRNVDFAITADFRSNEGYQVYAKDDRHIAIINEYIKPLLAEGGRSA